MARANIPRPDSDAAQWMRFFAQGLNERREVYHLSEAQSAELSSAVSNFRSALAVAIQDATRTKLTVAAKNRSRARAEQVCRRYYMMVRVNRDISDDDKLRVGVRPLGSRRSRSTAPTTRPVLTVKPAGGGHEVRWTDESAGSRAAKPAGCAMLQLFAARSKRYGESPDAAQLVNVYTGNRTKLMGRGLSSLATVLGLGTAEGSDGSADERRYVTYFARWASPTGQPGPWSDPQTVPLAA